MSYRPFYKNPKGAMVELPLDAETLNGHNGQYYATKSAVDGCAKLDASNTFSKTQILTGFLDIHGTAAEAHLKTRGICGSNGSGITQDLYLQYANTFHTHFGTNGQSLLQSDGGIKTSYVIENGTKLENKYLKINAKATDSNSLDGHDSSYFVNTSTTQDISGIKTFKAPVKANGEQVTTWFETANGGRVGFGKEGPNSGTGIFFEQKIGTRRLNFRASDSPGAMVWSQPETGARLYFDVGGYSRRITLPTGPGTIALTQDIKTKTSQLTNDSNFVTNTYKPVYVTDLYNNNQISFAYSSHGVSTASYYTCWNGYNLTYISKENLKTDLGINSKQETLVSGTNIKTINKQSILGKGNLNIIELGTSIGSQPTADLVVGGIFFDKIK